MYRSNKIIKLLAHDYQLQSPSGSEYMVSSVYEYAQSRNLVAVCIEFRVGINVIGSGNNEHNEPLVSIESSDNNKELLEVVFSKYYNYDVFCTERIKQRVHICLVKRTR